MPKWMDKCVESYMQKHPDADKSDAWAICTAQYKKKFGRLPATKQTEQQLSNMQEALQLTFSDGEKRELLRAAIREYYDGDEDLYVGFWIVAVYETHAVVARRLRLYAFEYIIDGDRSVQLKDPVEVVAAHVELEAAQLQLLMSEHWLPKGLAQAQLEDGDFAWLSVEYVTAPAPVRSSMNTYLHRKLPYKVHGKVSVEGWESAWLLANCTTYLRPDIPQGDIPAVLDLLDTERPGGVTSESVNDCVLLEGVLADIAIEEATSDELKAFSLVLSANVIPAPTTEYGAVSKNKRLYPPDAVKETHSRSRAFIQEGGVATVYTSHGAAVASSTLPVGRIIDYSLDDGALRFRAGIVDTTEGSDAIKLLDADVLKFVSLRTREWDSVVEEVGDLGRMEVMKWCTIHGIDFTASPGLPGTAVKKEEEETMKLTELTLKQLQEERPDLVAEIVEGVQTPEPQTETDAKLELDLAIHKAANTGMGSLIAAYLEEHCETVDDVLEHIGDARTHALNELYKTNVPAAESKPKGSAAPATPTTRREELSPQQREILEASGAKT